MNILITGGAGYVGSIVAAELTGAGHDVVVYDNLSRGKRAAIPAGAEFVVGDIEDRQALVNVLNNCKAEAVLHFAALIEAGESMKIP